MAYLTHKFGVVVVDVGLEVVGKSSRGVGGIGSTQKGLQTYTVVAICWRYFCWSWNVNESQKIWMMAMNGGHYYHHPHLIISNATIPMVRAIDAFSLLYARM